MSDQTYTTDTPIQRLTGELRTAKAANLPRAEFSVLDVQSVLAEATLTRPSAQAVSLPDRDKAAFEAAVGAERQRQIEKGYTPAHDDEKGAKHLVNWACDYIVKGEPVKAVALLVATLQHLERLSPAQLPDRETLGLLIDEARATLAQHDRVWANTSGNPLPTSGVSAALRKVIPVLAALSTQPAAGPTDEIPEADATPDEAFELGRVSGYDEAMREVTQPEAGEVEWGVYAEREGQFYSVTPATRENAEREAKLVGTGHRPVTAQQGRELRNAWSHGRMSEVEKQRTEVQS